MYQLLAGWRYFVSLYTVLLFCLRHTLKW